MPIYESIRWTWNLHYCCNIYLIKFVEVNIGRSQCLCRLGRDKQNNQDPEIERPIEIVVPNLFQVQKYERINQSGFRKYFWTGLNHAVKYLEYLVRIPWHLDLDTFPGTCPGWIPGSCQLESGLFDSFVENFPFISFYNSWPSKLETTLISTTYENYPE